MKHEQGIKDFVNLEEVLKTKKKKNGDGVKEFYYVTTCVKICVVIMDRRLETTKMQEYREDSSECHESIRF